MHRVVERAKAVARGNEASHYTYEKRSITKRFDSHDRPVETTDKIYRVILIHGLPFTRLIKVQGKELSPQQLEKEDKREAAFRQKVTRVDVTKKAAHREPVASADLVNQFEYTVVRREMVSGRPTLVLTFKAKPAKDESISDKVLHRLEGTLWVDEAEAEVARVDARLREPVSLGWLGMIGALTKCQLAFERLRLPDAVWVNAKTDVSIVGREVFKAMRFTMNEESSGFRKE